MVDVTEICNQALAAVGTRTSISSIAEQSNEARQCLLQYDSTRRQLLRSAHWGFARRYAVLSIVRAKGGTPESGRPPGSAWDANLDPPPPWLYGYALPTAYLAVRYILPMTPETGISPPIFGTQTASFPETLFGSGPMVKFEIASLSTGAGGSQTIILSNQSKAFACYTADVTEPDNFDETFGGALVNALATNICFALTGDLKLLDSLVKLTNSIILEARIKNANESLNAIDVMPDWFRARGLGPAVGTGPWVAEYGPLFGGVY